MKRFSVAVSCAAFLIPCASTRAQDWPGWRGPGHDGSSAAEGLPRAFDKEKGVRWSAELPGPGAATPIIVGKRVFVSSTDPAKEELIALCFDREDGRLLWRRAAGSGYRAAGAGSALQMHRRSNYASPSPVCDGERVVFFYGNGDLVAFDLEGERLWARNIQKDHGDFAFQWTFSASPLLWKGRLYLPVLQRDEPVRGMGREGSESFLLAMDPATGATLYRHVRPAPARRESLESYCTPIPFVGEEGREELLILGGDVLTGHDPATGKELWRWGTWNPGHREEWWRIVPSPVVGGGVILVCAPKNQPVYALRTGGKGELDASALVWKSGEKRSPLTSDVPTPLFYRGRFFILSDKRSALSRVDPASGAIEWSLGLDREYLWRASPTGADGMIWCMNHHGDVVVVDAEKGEIVHRAAMGEEDDDGIRSTLAVAHGCLFVRTHRRLYCIGKRD